jgi:hypothetical protein
MYHLRVASGRGLLVSKNEQERYCGACVRVMCNESNAEVGKRRYCSTGVSSHYYRGNRDGPCAARRPL